MKGHVVAWLPPGHQPAENKSQPCLWPQHDPWWLSSIPELPSASSSVFKDKVAMRMNVKISIVGISEILSVEPPTLKLFW